MKISIIGIGRVGSTLAYTIACKGLCQELVLINRTPETATGDAFDLQHGLPFLAKQMEIRAGAIEDSAHSDIIAVCASIPMSPSIHSRMELGPGNVKLFKTLIPQLAQHSPKAILLIVSNPVDVLTYFSLKFSGFDPKRVLGTGTLIDSARFRLMLSKRINIHPDDLRAYILGEHGDHQFPALSMAQAGGERILEDTESQQLFEQAVAAGFKVYRSKGYTNYAIALAASMIIEAIALNTCRTMPASVFIDHSYGVHDVCLSLPVVIGRTGIVRILHPPFNAQETEAFKKASDYVRQAIAQCSEP